MVLPRTKWKVAESPKKPVSGDIIVNVLLFAFYLMRALGTVQVMISCQKREVANDFKDFIVETRPTTFSASLGNFLARQ